jgi:alpha-glucoside transport system permease protein
MAQGPPVATSPAGAGAGAAELPDAAVAVRTRRQRGRGIDLRQLSYVLLFVGPSVFLIGLLIVYPAIKTIYNSFTTTVGIGYNAPQQLIGFKNFSTMFSDPAVQTAIVNNLLWLVVITPVTVVLGVIFAVLFDRVSYEPIPKSIVFVPMAISATAGGVIWRLMYADDPNTGTINAVLGWVHISPFAFLGSTNVVNWALFGAQIWLSLGFAVVVLSAALKAIPKELTEAAKIDGAHELQIFRHITVPLIWPTVTVIITLTMIGVLKIFDIIYTMTGGGPAGASEVLATRMYTETFKNFNPGYGSAIAVVLLIAVLPIMAINIQRFRTEGPR